MDNEETITEIAGMYSRMSLLDLLAEENTITRYLHTKTFDPLRKKLLQILRAEIEKRLL